MIETYLNQPWALLPSFHNQQAALAMHRLQQGKPAFVIAEQKPEPYFVSMDGPSKVASYSYERLSKPKGESGRIVVLPILGTMSRYGDLCTYGTEEYAAWIQEANDDPSISAIVLELNTPGGQVDGTEYLGQVVRQSQKPVVAWVAGMCASAGYWVASQCRHIMMESETTSEVGSIGVLAMHVDASQFYEQEGYKITIVRADKSKDKALFNSIEPLSEVVLSETRSILSIIQETFEETVKAGRPGISTDVFSGKMYIGRDAIKLKLADSIGFLGDAIQKADQLAKSA